MLNYTKRRNYLSIYGFDLKLSIFKTQHSFDFTAQLTSKGKLSNHTGTVRVTTFFGKFDTLCVYKVWMIVDLHPFFAYQKKIPLVFQSFEMHKALTLVKKYEAKQVTDFFKGEKQS